MVRGLGSRDQRRFRGRKATLGPRELTYTLTWTISNGVCVASATTVDIEFDSNPTTSAAGPDQQVCGSTSLPVVLAANAPVIAGETGVWSFVVNPDALPLTAFSNTASETSNFTGTAGQTYTLRWTLTNGLVCAPSTDDVVIQIDLDPTTSVAGAAQTGAIMGIPLIYTSHTWLDEVAQLAGCGVIIEEETAESVVKAIRTACLNEKTLREKANVGAMKVRAYHSVECFRDLLLKFTCGNL